MSVNKFICPCGRTHLLDYKKKIESRHSKLIKCEFCGFGLIRTNPIYDGIVIHNIDWKDFTLV